MTPAESWLLIIILGGTVVLAILGVQGLLDHAARVRDDRRKRREWDRHTAQALWAARQRHPSAPEDRDDRRAVHRALRDNYGCPDGPVSLEAVLRIIGADVTPGGADARR